MTNWTDDPIYDVQNLISGTECTGLIPSLSPDDEEMWHYAELYAIHPPAEDEKTP